jgi:hypothetical protein
LDDPEESEAGTHELLMKSSGSIGYRMKIFMKTVDGTARAYCNPSRDEKAIASQKLVDKATGTDKLQSIPR